VLDRVDATLFAWAMAHNPFYNGPWSDALSLIPFAVLVGLLYLAARGRILKPRAG